MNSQREAPTEEVLGVHVPLPIAPADVSGEWDQHHPVFPRNARQLQGWDQRPARWSRVQDLPVKLHRAFHRRHGGIWLPETDQEHFTLTFLNFAGYLPEHAVDVSRRSGVRRVELDENMRRHMQENNVMHIQRGRRWAIGLYCANYILRNGIEAVRETKEVLEYVEARNELERQKRTFGVVRAAATVVLENLEPTYEVARSKGNIRRMEPTATRFMLRQFDARQPDYITEIDRLLSIA